MLILVSTPIGNLKDFSTRAIDALREADLILCEDTRHSQKLLNHYQITKPLQSFHQFNEKKREDDVIKRLHAGSQIALISDAGTPALCDPGQRLISRCHQENISVTAIPGPSAVTTALCLSGFEAPPYQFGGFLPKKTGALRMTLVRALLYPGVSIFFDTPHHITDTLDALKELAPNHTLCIARELTKAFEEVLIGTASELTPTLKGEFCLVLDQGTLPYGDLKAVVHQLQTDFSLTQKEAIKIAAEIGGLGKTDLYKSFFN